MKRKIFGWAGILILTLACGLFAPAAAPTQTSVETIVAETFQALTVAAPAAETQTQTPAPTQVNGTVVAVNTISFVVPTGIGSGAQAKFIEAVPPSNDLPWWEIGPAYDQYLIQGYPLSGTFHEPRIYVYPVHEYIQMVPDMGAVVDTLKAIINSPGAPLPDGLPFLPVFNAAQVFHSNEQVIQFQNGTGIRFLTQYAQAAYPVNNNSLFYTFQGLTGDGMSYVSAILPINAAFLSADGNPETPLPVDGVPFDWENFENTPQHFELVTQKLNATDPNAFNPSLTSLDTLIQSIQISTP